METVLAGLQWKKCLVYLDDTIVVVTSFEDMLENLGEVFLRLHQADIKLEAKKCNLLAKRVSYLRYTCIISQEQRLRLTGISDYTCCCK
jgi:hypothetical protein